MISVEKSKTEQTAPEQYGIQHSPGEYLMLLIFFIILCPILFESLKVNGIFQGSLSGPGALPQTMSLLTSIMVLLVAINLIRSGIKPNKFIEVVNYLFCKKNVTLLIAVFIYAFFIGMLHFRIATLLFLTVCMWLLDKKRPINKFIISAITLIVLELIFSVIFKVILP